MNNPEGIKAQRDELREAYVVRGREYPNEAPPAAGEGFVVDAEAMRVVRLAYDAMNYLGDILNGHDMTEPEDVEKVTPAFDAVRAYLAARPQPAQGDGDKT